MSPYQPFGAARELFFVRDKQVVLVGPAGTGKSRATLEKLNACAEKYPGMRALMVRQVRADITETALVTYENKVLPDGSPVTANPINRGNRRSYVYPNGSEIVVGGLDRPGKVMSAEYDMIYVQEAIDLTEDGWEALTSRLRNGVMPYQQLIADTNPGAPSHWLKQRIDKGQTTCLNSRHQDNPVLFDHEKQEWTQVGRDYLDTLTALTGARKDRLLHGLWVSAEGARFPMMDAGVHRFKFADKFPSGIPESYRIILGVDYGLRAPYCCLWIAVDYDGDLWVFREDYMAGVYADDQPKRITAKTRAHEVIDAVYMDPAMWSAMPGTTGPSNICVADFYTDQLGEDKRFGPILRGFNKSRQHALATLDKLFNRGNGAPNLYIEEGCQNLWDELTGAEWDKDGREDIDAKCPDHAITALYYACHTYLDLPVEPRPAIPTPEEIYESHRTLRTRESERQFTARAKRMARRG